MESNLKIFNHSKFSGYTEIEKDLFYAFRDAQVLLMPKMNAEGEIDEDKGNYEDEALKLSENFAFKVVDLYPEKLKTKQIEFSEIETFVINLLNNLKDK